MSFICGDCKQEHPVPTPQEDLDGAPCFDALLRKTKALELQNSELRDDLEQRQQNLVDFAREEFGDEEGKTWEAPFTTEKFVEMVRDEMRRLHRLVGRMQNALEDIITKTVTAHDGGAILPIREMAQRGLGLTERPKDDLACPTCGQPAEIMCKCMMRDSKCPNGHEWHRCPVHGGIVLAPSVIHDSAACTCILGKQTEKRNDETKAKGGP